jgi:hypothetical protein
MYDRRPRQRLLPLLCRRHVAAVTGVGDASSGTVCFLPRPVASASWRRLLGSSKLGFVSMPKLIAHSVNRQRDRVILHRVRHVILSRASHGLTGRFAGGKQQTPNSVSIGYASMNRSACVAYSYWRALAFHVQCRQMCISHGISILVRDTVCHVSLESKQLKWT